MFSWFKRKKYCYECGHLTRADMMKELNIFRSIKNHDYESRYYCIHCEKNYDAVSEFEMIPFHNIDHLVNGKKYNKVELQWPNKGYGYAELDDDGYIKTE